jgi:hypothetical protein
MRRESWPTSIFLCTSFHISQTMLEGAAARLKTRLERPLHGKQFSEVKDSNGSMWAMMQQRGALRSVHSTPSLPDAVAYSTTSWTCQQPTIDRMKSSLIFSAALVAAVLATPAVGAESRDTWRWYYSGFGSPDVSAKVLLRSGSATVRKSKADITVAMKEVDGTTAMFIGKVSASQVNGMLNNFFPSESVSYHGTYKTLQVGTCKFEQIALSSGVPDGSIIMFSRVSGRCE